MSKRNKIGSAIEGLALTVLCTGAFLGFAVFVTLQEVANKIDSLANTTNRNND